MNYGFIKSKLDGTEKVFKSVQPTAINFEYKLPQVLNQGDKPICVPCSLSAFLNWDINLKDGKSTRDNNIDLTSIFNHGGTKNGMSFKEALSYLLSINKIKQFALVHTIDSLKTAIKANGPCVGALPVYDSNRPDFWNGESLLGGHAISIVGWNKTGFIIRNSWGTQFGNNGYTYLPYTDINKFYEIWTIIN